MLTLLGPFWPFWEVGELGGHGNRSSGHFGFLGRFRAPYILRISFSIEKIIVLEKVRIKKKKSNISKIGLCKVIFCYI